MKTLIYIFGIGIIIGLISFAKKNYVTCGLASGIENVNIESKIIQLKRIGIADTTIASISGKVYGKIKYLNKKDTIIENLQYANIWVTDKKTDSSVGTTSNLKGEFQFNVPASKYDLNVQFIGFNNIKVKNIKIGTGDIIDFKTILEPGDGVTEFKSNSSEFYNNTNK